MHGKDKHQIQESISLCRVQCERKRHTRRARKLQLYLLHFLRRMLCCFLNLFVCFIYITIIFFRKRDQFLGEIIKLLDRSKTESKEAEIAKIQFRCLCSLQSFNISPPCISQGADRSCTYLRFDPQLAIVPFHSCVSRNSHYQSKGTHRQ